MLNKTNLNLKVTCMAKLPWSNNKDINIITPCKTCSEEASSISGGTYCMECYRELLTLLILGKEID